MREILFRGQTRKFGEKVTMAGKKLPGKWVYGGIFSGTGDFSIIYGWPEDEKEHHGYNIDKYVVYTETVSQFTGLIDKNGTKIFENDIVEFEDLGEEGWEYKEGFNFTNRARVTIENYRVELTDWYSDNSARLEEMDDYYDCFIDGFKFCEVIGNIHDNPELLEANA